ncbi:hypothetical protein [Arthrobacter sp. GMC3]|uniref:hypothetical protein n=1 Tax=Arthrobacter sp. GMC3 TaxID=2058894 RepID=UPI0011AFE71E|nr:hypothetical protein [Arthrobacter sp. GMC3]
MAFTVTRGGGYGRGLPMNLEAIEAAAVLSKVVGPWQARQAKHIGGKAWAVGYLERLEEATAAAVKIVDLPAELIHIGACGSLLEDPDGVPVECYQELFVTADANTARCECCGVYWDVARRRENAITSAWNVLAPAPVVVRALATQGVRITPKHLENWQRLGHVSQQCDVETREAGYRVADVFRVAQRMTERRRN